MPWNSRRPSISRTLAPVTPVPGPEHAAKPAVTVGTNFDRSFALKGPGNQVHGKLRLANLKDPRSRKAQGILVARSASAGSAKNACWTMLKSRRSR